jgi:hypothetical protein
VVRSAEVRGTDAGRCAATVRSALGRGG